MHACWKRARFSVPVSVLYRNSVGGFPVISTSSILMRGILSSSADNYQKNGEKAFVATPEGRRFSC
jgi:hypothetical protein